MTTYVKQILLLASAALLLFAACHKKQPPTADTTTTPNPDIPSATATTTPADQPQGQPVSTTPLPPPTPVVKANAENSIQAGVNGQVDPFLTSQLRIFMNQKGRLPQSFTEFAAARLDSMPTPPTGMKWVIDSADGQVKAVQK